MIDVALNTRGVELERRAGRPVLGRLHAGHSLGLVAGALAGLAADAADVAPLAHVAAVAVVAAAAGLWAGGAVAEGAPARTPPAARGAALARPDRRLLLLGAVAAAAFALDAVAGSWIAVHLRADHGASPAVAAAGYTGFVAALAGGRLAADRLLARHDRARVVAACGALAGAGAGLVVLAPTLPLALAGWLALGLATAPLAPAVLGGAPALLDRPPPAALAAVSTLGYLGGVAGPPLVGLLAGPLSLGAGLAVLLVAALAVIALAGPALVPGGSAPPRPPRL